MKISIITINYNNANGLIRSIESIIPHSSPELEYIVIDGGSSDGSADIIKKHANNISYWVSEPDKGVFNAMNKGIDKASGEYLLFMNSGDILNQDCSLKKIATLLTGEEVIYFDIELANEGEDNNKWINTYPDSPDFKFFAERSLPHQAAFIKRKTLVEYGGYNENMKLASDWAFFVDAICLKQCSCKHVCEYFSTYYLDGISSQSDNFSLLWKEKGEHIKEHYSTYYSLYKEWLEKKDELYKLKTSVSVKLLKKVGFLKWLKP